MGNKCSNRRRGEAAYGAEAPEPHGEAPASTGDAALPPQGHGSLLGSCVVGSDRVAGACIDGSVVLFDLGKRSTRTLGAHTSPANRVAAPRVEDCGQAGYFVYSCSRDLTVKQWRVRDDDGAAPARVFEGHSLNVSAVCVDDGNGTVATGSRDCHVRTFDAGTAEVLTEVRLSRNVITCMRWFHGDSSLFAQGSEDLRLRIWDARAATKPAQTFVGYTYFPLCVDVSPDNHLVATGSKGFNSQGGEVRIWDRRSAAAPLVELTGHSQDCTGVCFLRDATSNLRVASVSKDSTIRVWDVANQTELPRVSVENPGMFTSLDAPNPKARDPAISCAAANFEGALFCLDADLKVSLTAEGLTAEGAGRE
ncbi:WD40-repeat-containing domain protein [Pelagophyceae sp. CCMP2097]|nr:WD40-repeat-containing domain protein [Pelagophyceae sp. CCMP2097]